MSANSLPDYIRFLLKPEVYPQPTTAVELIETHISYVILTDQLVYKWKKPVDFGFVNFSTLEKRKFFCEEELRLNRRLCPDIYKQLVWVTAEPEMVFNGNGPHFEYGIEMVRMPEERMMGRLIAANKVGKADIQALLNVLIPFYRNADQNGKIDENGTAQAVTQIISDNFRETAEFVGGRGLPSTLFGQIKSYTQNFLKQENLFARRIEAGRIRDCHGDLHSGNICLADKPYIFDCIEFNENLRYIDIAADLAFLAMDLDYYNLRHLSNQLVLGYVAITGDDGMLTMLNFYKCYRAYVRGKVALLTSLDPGLAHVEKEELCQKAYSYFNLAASYAAKPFTS